MPPRLRITAGPDVDHLARVVVNGEECMVIDTEAFQGRLMVRVKDFVGDTEDAAHKSSASYFEHPYGSSMTYSIQVQGRFLDGVHCDNLVFGNTFDEPIRDNLPYGTSLALRFLSAIDPNLKHDLYADNPWAFSPLLATMYRIQACRLGHIDENTDASAQECFDREDWPVFPSCKAEDDYVYDDITPLFYSLDEEKKPVLDANLEVEEGVVQKMNEKSNAQAPHYRAHWVGQVQNRKNIKLTREDVLTFDFCNGYVRGAC
ncbi:hypothetical protein MNAN1_002259 [Malassezia nana]|uniref:Domain of unknown function at the cortex 1 domain-containing protein n=1 Tax=Malassezia nana TaxID=180528 RepID=A0AAF0J3V0_9BASI|nr:hypothetical protein MNAN1_002259 [Malassezia nana]